MRRMIMNMYALSAGAYCTAMKRRIKACHPSHAMCSEAGMYSRRMHVCPSQYIPQVVKRRAFSHDTQCHPPWKGCAILQPHQKSTKSTCQQNADYYTVNFAHEF